MKVKEIDRTANIAWSPSGHHPIYLAAGTAAQQLDATFSTTATLEIYDLNLHEPCLDMTLKGSINSDFRFHKIVWGCMKSHTSDVGSGLIVGGADGGSVLIYDPAKIISGEDALVYHKTKHSGPVHTLDFNKFQECLLASGGSESEIYIWDLNNPSSPVTPGVKSQPADDVTSIAWNCQVQHILASTFPSRCVVWDLRKNEPIIKVSDSASRMHCKMVAWHPEVATQLCIASDDDHSPLIQLWDLRFATTPVRNLEYHQRGILSIAWCPQDPDLLLSCAKDNKICCWNPNSTFEGGEVVCELPTSSQWSFDVAWCPRNPAVIASSSCDGHVSVYSLMGGQHQSQCSSKIAESFPGSDKLSQPHVAASTQKQVQLSRPPKWLRRPVGAHFSFGGKLISFTNEHASHPTFQVPQLINLSQVITDPDILENTAQLESALDSGTMRLFCQNKLSKCGDLKEKMKWEFLEATFSDSPRPRILSLLGYNYQKISAEVSEKIAKRDSLSDDQDFTISELKNRTSMLGLDDEQEVTTRDGFYKHEEPFIIHANSGDFDGLLSRSLLTGNIDAAVELCIQESRWPDAFVLSYSGGHSLMEKTQKLYFDKVKSSSSKLISAVALSDWPNFIINCDVGCWKEALAAILTYAKPEIFVSLCELLGTRMEKESDGLYKNYAALCYICAGSLERLAELWTKEGQCGTISLQNIIEQIMILRYSMEKLSGSTPTVQSGTVSSLLSQFATLLASQGNLKSAAMFLSNSKEESCLVLQDRIYQSLGHPTPFFPFKRIEIQKEKHTTTVCVKAPNFPQSGVQNMHLPHRKSFYDAQVKSNQIEEETSAMKNYDDQTKQRYPLPGSVLQAYAQQPPTITGSFSFSTSTSHLQHFTSASAGTAVTNTCISQHPAVSTLIPPADSTVFPSSSVVKGSSGHHLSQKYPKHLHDPSVYSDNQREYLSPYAPVVPQQPEVNCYNTSISQPSINLFNKDHSGAASFSTSYSTPFYSPVTGYSTQVLPSVSSESLPQMTAAVPSSYGEIETGWNDPPWLKQSPPKQSVCHEVLAPITTPLTGSVEHDASQPFVPVANFTGNSYVPHLQEQYEPVEPVKDISLIQSKQKVLESSKEKGPIPPEHQILQDTFEDLRRQCQQVATNPQSQRKLEDVAKKMENLYDRLRESSLSSTVMHGLHQIVHAVLQGDYLSALNAHAHIVSSANFSEISGFIPSVKILLQTASQLGVALQ